MTAFRFDGHPTERAEAVCGRIQIAGRSRQTGHIVRYKFWSARIPEKRPTLPNARPKRLTSGLTAGFAAPRIP